MDAEEILFLLEKLNDKLREEEVRGSIQMVGGAVMTVVFGARASTMDVDALLRPSDLLREAAAQVADENGYPTDWLNDGAKGFFGGKETFDEFTHFSNLDVFTMTPDALLAMKACAMRGDKDEQDLRFLVDYLKLPSFSAAVSLITKFYPDELINVNARYVLLDIFGNDD